jgi:hypothetical protein
MLSTRRLVWLACAALALHANGADATTVRSVSMSQMAQVAELVFEGRVLSQQAQGEGRKIRTCIAFEVLDVVKGPAIASPFELCFSGGTRHGRTRRIHGMRHPQPGEHGIYFVETLRAARVNPLLGWGQGHFRVADDESGTVETADGQQLLSVEADDGSGAMLSRGIARGARVRAPQARSAATDPAPLSSAEFKDRIRALLGEGE